MPKKKKPKKRAIKKTKSKKKIKAKVIESPLKWDEEITMPTKWFKRVKRKDAKKKLRPKVVSITGTERVAGLLKNKETVVRISHG